MSSALNGHPPQTYSRLFRPWDINQNGSTNNPTVSMRQVNAEAQPHNTASVVVKVEHCSPCVPTTAPYIKTEQNCSYYSSSCNDSDRECASSSSSSTSSSSSSIKSSYEDGLNNLHTFNKQDPTTITPTSTLQKENQSSDSQNEGKIPTTPPTLPRLFEHHLPTHSHPLPALTANIPPSNNELLYAVGAAANSLGMPAMGAFGMDPYTLGLMEHEYARVMAEEAHLKAVNARKQRPKKFKCPHCDVAFSNNGQLKGHIRIHTGERPFKCDVEICGKTFTRNEELTRHKRIHTGLRPYPCTTCGKKFGRRDHLKKHLKTHMPQERQLGPAIFVPMYPYLYGY